MAYWNIGMGIIVKNHWLVLWNMNGLFKKQGIIIIDEVHHFSGEGSTTNWYTWKLWQFSRRHSKRENAIITPPEKQCQELCEEAIEAFQEVGASDTL